MNANTVIFSKTNEYGGKIEIRKGLRLMANRTTKNLYTLWQYTAKYNEWSEICYARTINTLIAEAKEFFGLEIEMK